MRKTSVRLAAAAATVAVAIGGFQAAGSGQTKAPTEAITAARFAITIDGYEIASFTELAGITSAVEVNEYYEVNDSGSTLKKLPGALTPPTVTLKRGLNGSLELWAWHEAIRTANASAARRSASLTMFNSDGKPVVKYWLEKAYPSRLELEPFRAGSSTALVESVVLTAEFIQRIAP